MYGANAPVEVTGFEPAISWSQTRRDSQTTPHLDVRDLKLKRLNDRRDQLFLLFNLHPPSSSSPRTRTRIKTFEASRDIQFH